MKKTIVIPLILLIIAIPVVPYIVGNLYFSHAKQLELNWGITIPTGYKERFHIKATGFHGDGERYTVYSAKRDNASIGDSFCINRNTKIEMQVNTILNNLEVPIENRPPMKATYYWKKYIKNDDSSLMIIYSLTLPITKVKGFLFQRALLPRKSYILSTSVTSG